MSHGGKRKGAGRKPCTDKKETIILYIRQSKIESFGGKELLKKLIYKFLGT
jgi:hypothetical protein